MDIAILLFAVFGVIGLVAAITVVAILFTSFGKNVSSINVSGLVPSVRDEQFLLNLATVSGASTFHFDEKKCQMITSNSEYKRRLYEDIDSAKESISIMTYVWKYDEESETFFERLKRAATRGVTVRLIIDAHGSTINDSVLDELREANIQIVKFRPFKLGKLTLYYARTHRRAYLFDGKVGYLGGMAISQHWFNDQLPNDYIYLDVMYRITGDGVLPIAASFGEIWSTYASNLAQNLYLTSEHTPTQHNAVALSHIPRNDVHPLTSALWYACKAARKEILLITPYFVPGEAMMHILAAQAKAGVKVTIITQGTNESRYVRYAARSYYDALLAAGVRIFEHKRPHLHTKVLVIDGHFTLIGSANLDIRSQRINHELVIGVQSETFASENRKLQETYQDDLEEITEEIRHQTSFLKKFAERLTHLVSEQF